MSLVLCFSILISSFKAFSFIFNLRASSFCFCFSNSIFCLFSLSISSSLIFLFCSSFKNLYCEIEFAILSKNAWIYFSKLKLILKLIFGFKENWNLTSLEIKLFCLISIDFIFFCFFFVFVYWSFFVTNFLDFILFFFFIFFFHFQDTQILSIIYW